MNLRDPKLRRILAHAAGALFVVLAALHVAALLRLGTPNAALLALALPVLLVGQLVVVAGLQRPQAAAAPAPADGKRVTRLMLAGLRRIPMVPRVFGLLLWYGYTPLTFLTRLGRVGGSVHEVNGQFVVSNHGQFVRTLTADEAMAAHADVFSAVTAVVGALVFAQFVLLQYIVPNRDAILADVDGQG